MQYVEVHNPDAKLLEAWMARQERTRDVMLRRRLVPWKIRKQQPEMVELILQRLDTMFRENARNYAKSAP